MQPDLSAMADATIRTSSFLSEADIEPATGATSHDRIRVAICVRVRVQWRGERCGNALGQRGTRLLFIFGLQ
jgi:hypothetical protein